LAETALVIDMVYVPAETALVRGAKARGMRTIDGLEMLIEQARGAFQLFYSAFAPRSHDTELRELLTR
jgi:shikimate dehydrogenase